MIFLVFYIIIFVYILYSIKKKNLAFTIMSTITSYFNNAKTVYSDSNITLYTGDKFGNNFILAVKPNSTAFSSLDISTLYEKATQLHIHNKIIVTDIPLNSSTTYRKLKEYEIEIWNSNKLNSFLVSNTSTSPLQTSDTSDDTCDIEEDSNDPIQNGAFHTHSLFSGNKIEHL